MQNKHMTIKTNLGYDKDNDHFECEVGLKKYVVIEFKHLKYIAIVVQLFKKYFQIYWLFFMSSLYSFLHYLS